MASVRISKDIQEGKIVVTFSYEPKFVAIVKTIEGQRLPALPCRKKNNLQLPRYQKMR